jgi:hypothetical protein
VAGGYYAFSDDGGIAPISEGFVASESGGTWGKPQVLTLSPGGFPGFSGADDHVSAIS